VAWGADLVREEAYVQLAVVGDVEMIADVGKKTAEVTAVQGLYRQLTIAAGAAAMNYEEVHLLVVLIETSCFHTA